MDNAMVPAGGAPGAAVPAFSKANASGAITAPSADVMGGGNFGEAWKIDKDRHCFVNKKTNEARMELYVIVAEAHPNRVLFIKGQEGRACYSDDATSSYQGIACASCPRVSEAKVFNEHYNHHTDQSKPQYVGDCSLRYTLAWNQEFVPTQQGLVLVQHAEKPYLSCPKSSVYAMFGSNAYMPKLQQMGHDITKVVTKVTVKQRMNESIKSMYDFADFEFAGTVADIMARVVRTVTAEAGQAAQPTAIGAPAPAPTAAAVPQASFPGQFPPGTPPGLPASGLPAMAGPQPGPALAAFPGPAAPAAFPGPAAPAAPAAFPGPAAAPAAAAFPGPAAPAAAPAAAAPAAAPTFATMARQAVVTEFSALPANMQAIVLNLLGAPNIGAVPDEKLVAAQQALQHAKTFVPGAPAAVAPGQPGYPF